MPIGATVRHSLRPFPDITSLFLHLKGWDQNSLESCLLAHIPNDEKCRALVTSCMPSLWKLVTYFAQWPFVSTAPPVGTDSTSTTRLPFDALVRATAFLCGRHSLMFSHYNDKRDRELPRRTDRLALEHIFRALAIDAGQDTATNTASGWIPRSSHSARDDVFDTVNTVQPIMNEFTDQICRDELSPLVTRLLPHPSEESAPAPALSSLAIPTTGPGGIFELLDLFVLLLRHADKFDPTPTPDVFAKELETARTELQDADRIGFGAFYKWLGDDIDLNVYDAVALLFNLLLYPTSLTDGIAINGDELVVYALRRPGCKLMSD